MKAEGRGEKSFALNRDDPIFIMKIRLTVFALVSALCAFSEVELSVQPQHSRALPGELQCIDLTIEMDSAFKAVLRVPHSSNLLVRAVERYPVARSSKGGFLQKRRLVFQGVESGITVMTNLMVETGGTVHCFPPLTIEVLDVEKAKPPKAAEEKKINGKSLDEILEEMPEKTRGPAAS
jgi:hypothetical protein